MTQDSSKKRYRVGVPTASLSEQSRAFIQAGAPGVDFPPGCDPVLNLYGWSIAEGISLRGAQRVRRQLEGLGFHAELEELDAAPREHTSEARAPAEILKAGSKDVSQETLSEDSNEDPWGVVLGASTKDVSVDDGASLEIVAGENPWGELLDVSGEEPSASLLGSDSQTKGSDPELSTGLVPELAPELPPSSLEHSSGDSSSPDSSPSSALQGDRSSLQAPTPSSLAALSKASVSPVKREGTPSSALSRSSSNHQDGAGFFSALESAADARRPSSRETRPYAGKTQNQPLSPSIVAVLSAVIPGLGLTVLGRPGDGLKHLFGAPFILPWMRSVTGARALAEKMERGRAAPPPPISAKSVGVHLGLWLIILSLFWALFLAFTGGDKSEEDRIAVNEISNFSAIDAALEREEEEELRLKERQALEAKKAKELQVVTQAKKAKRLFTNGKAVCGTYNHIQCMILMEEILELSPDHGEARSLLVSARGRVQAAQRKLREKKLQDKQPEALPTTLDPAKIDPTQSGSTASPNPESPLPSKTNPSIAP